MDLYVETMLKSLVKIIEDVEDGRSDTDVTPIVNDYMDMIVYFNNFQFTDGTTFK